MNFWQRLFSRKQSEARTATAYHQIGLAQPTPANYEGFSKEGYQKNVTVFRAVSMIARSAATIDIDLFNGRSKREIEDHAILTLMDRPNPMQGKVAFLEGLYSYFSLSGNGFIEAVGPRPGAAPRELYAIQSDKMKIVPAKNGFPSAYIYKDGQVEKKWEVDYVNGKSQIMHAKTFHPTNIWYGMSPLESAMLNLDQNNMVNTWNLSLLRNMATPSGVFQVEITDANPTGTLTNESFERLKSEIDLKYSGPRNAGKPMVLEGGMKWQAISMSPKDMDFVNNKNTTSRDVALALGVPPMLLGIPGDNTYSNYQEARAAFYEETVIPLAKFMVGELNNWLVPAFGDNLKFEIDVDSIEALEPRRSAKYTGLIAANWLTVNEKRAAVGYEEKDGWDVIMVGAQGYDINEPFLEPVDDSADTPPLSENNTPTLESDAEGNESDEENDSAPDSIPKEGNESEAVKAVNLLTRREKRQSWKRQNQRRDSLENALHMDLKDDFARMYVDLKKAVTEASSPHVLEFALVSAIDKSGLELRKTLEKHSKRALREFGSYILDGAKSYIPGVEKKASVKFEQFVSAWAERRSGEAITPILGTTKKQVRKQLQEIIPRAIETGMTGSEIANELESTFETISKGRARTIARTETTMATQTGSLEAAKSLEIPNLQKEWVSAQDDRVRGLDPKDEANHAVMNGQKVGVDEKFAVPPDAYMDGPGDSSADAGQLCNCRCVLVYGIGNQ